MKWGEFFSGVDRTPCSECIEVYEEVYRKTPPCDICMPESLEINSPYLELYKACSDQYIMGPGGAIGLNVLAVDRIMDYKGVDMDEREDFFAKVKYIAANVIKCQRDQQEVEQANARRRASTKH